jgi:DNA-binding NarL/FixJ family response regulator
MSPYLEESMATVWVIDNCSVFHLGIRILLETDHEIELFTEQQHHFPVDSHNHYKPPPDVLVLSSRSSQLMLPELVNQSQNYFPATHILALLEHPDETCIHQLVENGVTSCLLRSEPTEKLVQAIHKTAKGESCFSRPLLSKLLASRQTLLTQDTRTLTKKELKILRLVIEDKTIADMDPILQVSDRTICNYLQRIRTKMDAKTTTSAVFRAAQLGILSV